MKQKYDVALSFAEEDRNVALCIYLALKLHNPKLRIYYYPKEGGATAGTDLKKQLPEVYTTFSGAVIMIVSAAYVNPDKKYVPIEIDALIERHKHAKKPFLIPLRVDETELDLVHPSLHDSIAWHKWTYEPQQVVETVGQMLRLKPKKAEKAIGKYFHKATINQIKAKTIEGKIIQGSNNKMS